MNFCVCLALSSGLYFVNFGFRGQIIVTAHFQKMRSFSFGQLLDTLEKKKKDNPVSSSSGHSLERSPKLTQIFF